MTNIIIMKPTRLEQKLFFASITFVFLLSQYFTHFFSSPYPAFTTQLGERHTEGLKVLCQTHGEAFLFVFLQSELILS